MNLEPGARVWSFTPPPEDVPGHPGRWEEIKIGPEFGGGGTANVYEKPPFPASQTLIKVFHIEISRAGKADFYAKLHTMTQRHLKLKDRLPFVAWPNAILF